MTSVNQRSTARPHWLSLLTLVACLLLALTGSLTLGVRANAGESASIIVAAHQNDYLGVDAVHVNAQITSLGLHNHDGICDLSLTKAGRGAIGKVTIHEEAADAPPYHASCGFSVMKSNLSTGYWSIRVRYHSDLDDIDVTDADSIYVN